VELRAEVDALSAEEAKGTLDKATAKELKNLRAKLTLKERKHGGGACGRGRGNARAGRGG
jgi:hypothetical protein